MTVAEVARRIQHTNVRLDATQADIEQLLAECVEHSFHAAVVSPIWLARAVKALGGTDVRVCTALDLPLGGETTATVVRAAAEARHAGADEIDVMAKVGWLRSEMDIAYRMHLAAVVGAADGAPVKAVLETVMLTKGEVALAVELCADAGVSYLKNASGLNGGEASPAVVRDLVRLARGRMKVKASGEIRTMDEAQALFAAGADLIGSNSSVEIVSAQPGAEPAETAVAS
ncbi:MAG TPA: deoxyribose-phosphate aldolase [Actinomycetota bacterium]|jgi:deoxyribose-phosphate aldolase